LTALIGGATAGVADRSTPAAGAPQVHRSSLCHSRRHSDGGRGWVRCHSSRSTT